MDTETIQNGIKVITSIFDQVRSFPAHLLLILLLNVIGMILKVSPLPNRAIPFIILLIGSVFYPFLTNTGNVDPSFSHPMFVLCIYGFLLGFGAIVLHLILKQFEKFRALEEGIVNAFRRDESTETPKEQK